MARTDLGHAKFLHKFPVNAVGDLMMFAAKRSQIARIVTAGQREAAGVVDGGGRAPAGGN